MRKLSGDVMACSSSLRLSSMYMTYVGSLGGLFTCETLLVMNVIIGNIFEISRVSSFDGTHHAEIPCKTVVQVIKELVHGVKKLQTVMTQCF